MESLNTTTDRFTFDKVRQVLVAEASSLGLKPGEWPLQLWIYSPRTRRTVGFGVDHKAEIANEGWDGEEKHYCLIHARDAVDKTVRAKKVILIND